MIKSAMSGKTSTSAATKAMEALKALQEDARRKGLDKMSMSEIDAEIAACRGEKRITRPRDRKTAQNQKTA